MKLSTTITVRLRAALTISLALACFVAASAPARADLVFGIADASATVGSSSNSFDVTLTNSGPSDVVIAGFSFEITTTSAHVNFSDVTVSTQSAPYIFCAYSEFGPDITIFASGNTVLAGDNYVTPYEGVTLATGQTLDLGHVVFALDSTAPSTPIPINFTTDASTGVNDPNGIPFQDLSIPGPGVLTIQVGGAAAPEPSSFVLALQGLLLFGYIAKECRYRTSREKSGEPGDFAL
jgi:hypothetical protein